MQPTLLQPVAEEDEDRGAGESSPDEQGPPGTTGGARAHRRSSEEDFVDVFSLSGTTSEQGGPPRTIEDMRRELASMAVDEAIASGAEGLTGDHGESDLGEMEEQERDLGERESDLGEMEEIPDPLAAAESSVLHADHHHRGEKTADSSQDYEAVLADPVVSQFVEDVRVPDPIVEPPPQPLPAKRSLVKSMSSSKSIPPPVAPAKRVSKSISRQSSKASVASSSKASSDRGRSASVRVSKAPPPAKATQTKARLSVKAAPTTQSARPSRTITQVKATQVKATQTKPEEEIDADETKPEEEVDADALSSSLEEDAEAALAEWLNSGEKEREAAAVAEWKEERETGDPRAAAESSVLHDTKVDPEDAPPDEEAVLAADPEAVAESSVLDHHRRHKTSSADSSLQGPQDNLASGAPAAIPTTEQDESAAAANGQEEQELLAPPAAAALPAKLTNLNPKQQSKLQHVLHAPPCSSPTSSSPPPPNEFRFPRA